MRNMESESPQIIGSKNTNADFSESDVQRQLKTEEKLLREKHLSESDFATRLSERESELRKRMERVNIPVAEHHAGKEEKREHPQLLQKRKELERLNNEQNARVNRNLTNPAEIEREEQRIVDLENEIKNLEALDPQTVEALINQTKLKQAEVDAKLKEMSLKKQENDKNKTWEEKWEDYYKKNEDNFIKEDMKASKELGLSDDVVEKDQIQTELDLIDSELKNIGLLLQEDARKPRRDRMEKITKDRLLNRYQQLFINEKALQKRKEDLLWGLPKTDETLTENSSKTEISDTTSDSSTELKKLEEDLIQNRVTIETLEEIRQGYASKGDEANEKRVLQEIDSLLVDQIKMVGEIGKLNKKSNPDELPVSESDREAPSYWDLCDKAWDLDYGLQSAEEVRQFREALENTEFIYPDMPVDLPWKDLLTEFLSSIEQDRRSPSIENENRVTSFSLILKTLKAISTGQDDPSIYSGHDLYYLKIMVDDLQIKDTSAMKKLKEKLPILENYVNALKSEDNFIDLGELKKTAAEQRAKGEVPVNNTPMTIGELDALLDIETTQNGDLPDNEFEDINERLLAAIERSGVVFLGKDEALRFANFGERLIENATDEYERYRESHPKPPEPGRWTKELRQKDHKFENRLSTISNALNTLSLRVDESSEGADAVQEYILAVRALAKINSGLINPDNSYSREENQTRLREQMNKMNEIRSRLV